MVSSKAKGKLDYVLELLSKEGVTVWGFIVDSEQDELQTFANTGDSVDMFLHNTREALKAL